MTFKSEFVIMECISEIQLQFDNIVNVVIVFLFGAIHTLTDSNPGILTHEFFSNLNRLGPNICYFILPSWTLCFRTLLHPCRQIFVPRCTEAACVHPLGPIKILWHFLIFPYLPASSSPILSQTVVTDSRGL